MEERTSDLALLNAELHQEIAVRKQVEEELRVNKDKIQAIVDAFDGLIFICSKDYRIQFMNKGFIDRTGCDKPGEFCYKAMHRRDTVCPGCDVESVFDGKTVHRELHNPLNGQWDYVVDVPLYHADGTISRQTISTDITELKQTEEKLRQKKQQLENLNRTLEMRVQEEVEKNRNKDILLIHQNRQAALGETLDHIAHQWKQPLNALSLITGSLQEEALSGKLTDESLTETTATILGLVDHMAQTINVFRDFYRPEKEMNHFSSRKPSTRPCHSSSRLCDSNLLKSIFMRTHCWPHMGTQRNMPRCSSTFSAMPERHFKDKGVEKPRVSIQAIAENGNAVVTVTDNAGGIPDANIGRIFDLYFTTREPSGGTGIGLYMSKNIIEKNMGGKLSVRNTGCGAEFRIETDRFDSLRLPCQRIKSVVRKWDFLSLTILVMISRFSSVSRADTTIRIEKILKASETDCVPSAESFRPLKGKVSGLR